MQHRAVAIIVFGILALNNFYSTSNAYIELRRYPNITGPPDVFVDFLINISQKNSKSKASGCALGLVYIAGSDEDVNSHAANFEEYANRVLKMTSHNCM